MGRPLVIIYDFATAPFMKGAVAKSNLWKEFLIYEEMRKYLLICEAVVSHI
jgi:hypothetical protein